MTARFRPSDFADGIPGPAGQRFTTVFEHGTLTVELYAPVGADLQTPHSRDEAYMVIRGTGVFVHGSERETFGPGDFLFAPAAQPHRFEEFTNDILVWVIFYGPEGGESTFANTKTATVWPPFA